MSRVETKQFAKDKIKGNLGNYWKGMILVYLAEVIITVLCNKLFGVGYIKSTTASLITSILLAPLTIGLLKYADDLMNGNNPEVNVIFSYYSKFLNITVMTAISSIIVSIGTFLLVIPGIYLSLSFAVAPYLIMKDKNLDPIDALKQSFKKMNGHRLDLLVFSLSFLGWILLVLATFGIAIIWVGPYMQVATLKYYEQITA